MINIYLDDIRSCPRGFVVARSAEECLLLLGASEVDILSLDFELGYGEPNGLTVVHGIIASGKYPKHIYVHSSSMMGRAQMVRDLRAANPDDCLIHDGPMPANIAEAAAAGHNRDA